MLARRWEVFESLKELAEYHDLLIEWTSRNIRARYQQSLLSWAWTFIVPAAQAAMLSVVFTRFVAVSTAGIPYAVFCYVALTAWTFLANSLTDMSNALVDNRSLLTKIYFPREILPIAAMLARLVDFAVASVLLLALLAYFQLPLIRWAWIALPLVIAVQVLLILGIGLACAAVNVFFRDVRSVLILGLQLWLYASPVIYPADSVPERFRAVYSLNPMVGVIEAYRGVLLRGEFSVEQLYPAMAMALLLFVAGHSLFKRLEFRFADVI
jgi:lipopolysaccharide transport system permease protein